MSLNGDLAPAGVPISPVPTQYSVGQGAGPDGTVWVLLIVDSPMGRNVFHLTPDNAKVIGDGLAKVGAAGSIILGSQLPGAN